LVRYKYYHQITRNVWNSYTDKNKVMRCYILYLFCFKEFEFHNYKLVIIVCHILLFSLFTTLLAILPSCIHLGLNPDNRRLVYCLANSALAFFMFSFQVHEKSILLPALPITLLILDEPFWSSWFNNVAVFRYYTSYNI
jgi:hypothetical protein